MRNSRKTSKGSSKLDLQTVSVNHTRGRLQRASVGVMFPVEASCKRYGKTMLLTSKFIAHLPSCRACKQVMAYLNRESEIELGRPSN
jgi:hypothetical protein